MPDQGFCPCTWGYLHFLCISLKKAAVIPPGMQLDPENLSQCLTSALSERRPETAALGGPGPIHRPRLDTRMGQ